MVSIRALLSDGQPYIDLGICSSVHKTIIAETMNIAKSAYLPYSNGMGIKGIIFDKDGTLFDYGKVWGPVVRDAIYSGLQSINIPDDKKKECAYAFMRVLGVDADGNTYPDGIIFRHDRLIAAFFRVLAVTLHYHINPVKVGMLFRIFLSKDEKGIAKRISTMEFPGVADVFQDAKRISTMEFPGVADVFQEADRRGYRMGIVTNDSTVSTKLFLDRMGISQYIVFLRTKDSHVKAKPNPEALREFCQENGLESSEVAIIGDTLVDMEFAHQGKAGYRIAVLTGSGDLERLRKNADAVYPTLHDVLKDPVLFPEN